jgi:chromosome segregation ATPase
MKYAIIILMAGSTMLAHAETRGRGGDDATYNMKQMIRQLSQERDALKAEKLRLDEENRKIKKDLENKGKELAMHKDKLDKSGERGKLLSQRLEESHEAIRQLRDKQRELEQNLQLTTVSRDTASADLRHCMAMNIKLFDAGLEVLKLYEDEASGKVGIFLQLKTVDVENTVQDYRVKMEDLTIQSKPESTPPATTATQMAY